MGPLVVVLVTADHQVDAVACILLLFQSRSNRHGQRHAAILARLADAAERLCDELDDLLEIEVHTDTITTEDIALRVTRLCKALGITGLEVVAGLPSGPLPPPMAAAMGGGGPLAASRGR